MKTHVLPDLAATGDPPQDPSSLSWQGHIEPSTNTPPEAEQKNPKIFELNDYMVKKIHCPHNPDIYLRQFKTTRGRKSTNKSIIFDRNKIS